MKKVISYISILTLIFTMLVPTVSADTAGEKIWDVDLSKYESIANGKFYDGKLCFNGQSSATLQVYVPFRAKSIDFKFSGSSAVKIYLNDRLIETSFSNLSKTVNLEPNILGGQYQMIIVTETPIEINKIFFTRTTMHPGSLRTSYEVMPNFTDYQKALQMAIVVSPDSPVIMVNGGRRYVNVDNPKETPYVDDMGQIYLPLHSFSRAFEYYYEERENEWVITKDKLTFHYKDGVLTKQNYSETPKVIANITKNINGTTYLPLKYFAEFEGKTIVKKDNIYVLDYLANVNDILADDIFPQLKANYDQWSLGADAGTTYYVSQASEASDSNPGTYEKPFKTIAKAAEIAKAGDTVIIRGGVYHEILAPKNNGTAANPITFKAADGETVQLSTLKELGAPISAENGLLVYEALTDLGDGKNQIFQNGTKHLVPGRYPNEDTNPNAAPMQEGLDPVWPVQGNMTIDAMDAAYVVSDTDLEQPKDHWVGATVVIMEGYGWTLGTGIVDESDYGWLHCTKRGRWWYDPENLATDYGYITNHINTIDLPGEWAFKDGKIYIMPPEGETAETLKLQQKMHHVAFDLTDSKYIRIEGIDSIGGGAKMNNSEMCVFTDGKYEYISQYIYSHDQRDGYIDDRNKYNQDGPPERGEQGFYVGGTDNAFVNNEFLFSAAAALFVTGTYTYIENNYVADTGYGGSYVGGIYSSGRAYGEKDDPRGGAVIFSNTIARTGRHGLGISMNEDWFDSNAVDTGVAAYIPEIVAYNDVYDGSITARDTAPWYQYGVAAGTERAKTRHYNNLVWNSWAAEGSMNALFYYDGMASMFQNYNNITFWDNEGISYGKSLYIQHLESAVGIVDHWDNSQLEYFPGGKDALTKKDYPGGRMFRSGASWLAKDQTPYLNNMNTDIGMITVEQGKASQGSEVVDGQFVPAEDGAYIAFNNVDLGKGSSLANAVTLYFTGNPCNTKDKITLKIGPSVDNPITSVEATLEATAPNEYVVDTKQITFEDVSGTQNVYIVFDEVKSAKLTQIRLNKSTNVEDRLVTGVYADQGTVEAGDAKLHTMAPEGHDGHKYFRELYKDSGFLYKNVEIGKECNEFMLKYGSAGFQLGQVIEVYIDSPEGEKIAELTSKTINWTDFSTQTFPLLKVLEPGTYNLYIKFVDGIGGDGETAQTGNYLWFGLAFNSEYEIAETDSTEE